MTRPALDEMKAMTNDLYNGVPLEDMAVRYKRTPREITYYFCDLGILKWEAFNELPSDAFDPEKAA